MIRAIGVANGGGGNVQSGWAKTWAHRTSGVLGKAVACPANPAQTNVTWQPLGDPPRVARGRAGGLNVAAPNKKRHQTTALYNACLKRLEGAGRPTVGHASTKLDNNAAARQATASGPLSTIVF